MSEGNGSFLRFSLEESVWFQKGQEVAELLTISLDPNITIHENEQYVTIEGALHLSGEYKRQQVEGDVEEEFPASPKFIQQVEDRGEGLTEFSHRFPVDITIPKNRIESIYDIDVEIESFDYSLPERSCMKLTADLAITGLINEEQPSKAEEEQPVELPDLELAFRGPDQEEPRVQSEITPEIQQLEETVPPANELFAPFQAEARKSSEEEEQEEATPIQLDMEKTPTLQVNETEQVEISFSAQRNESPEYENDVPQQEAAEQVEVEYESPVYEESSSSSSEEVVKKKKKISKKQGISITEFLARKEAEDDVARLKVCIVQNGDTLDLIAERYEVSTQQLMKVNHLEVNQDVYEGQVLYIPATVSN